jgi:curved DNA-binding protein CbpA
MSHSRKTSGNSEPPTTTNPTTLKQSRCRFSLRSLLITLLLFYAPRPVFPVEENLYKILGVQKTATIQEIKKAYRRKALESHPDKNLDLPPEQATQEFQKVVHAFEVLSNENARRHYDQTGRTTKPPTKEHNNQFHRSGGFQFHFQTAQQRKAKVPEKIPLKDQYRVREAMGRVLRVTSLQQLKAIMLKNEEIQVTKTEELLEDRPEEIFIANESMKVTRKYNITKVTTTTYRIEHETVERHLVS